ncbi:hypothetical protein MPOR_37690 [Mycolicibacterium poriferae]|uniref:Uncharacterized protein n=1 Tax=Mycolicibacterium poriferae TaxID=39694 RepID=A0A6N4VF58_9MYCO|nr:hypothetical protein MPOR_37690 [Mycolicibacterium poriferae]
MPVSSTIRTAPSRNSRSYFFRFSGISTPIVDASTLSGEPQIRLVGAVLAEQHDEWAESGRYLGLDVLSKSRTVNDTPTEQEDTPAALTA